MFGMAWARGHRRGHQPDRRNHDCGSGISRGSHLPQKLLPQGHSYLDSDGKACEGQSAEKPREGLQEVSKSRDIDRKYMLKTWN